MYPTTFVVSIEKCEPPGGVNLPAKRPVSLVSVHQRANGPTPTKTIQMLRIFPWDFGAALAVACLYSSVHQRSDTKHADPHDADFGDRHKPRFTKADSEPA